MEKIRLVEDHNDVCGESPIWEPDEKSLYWCDTEKKLVYCYEYLTKKVEKFEVDRTVRAIGRAGNGKWLLVTTEGLYLWKKGEFLTQFLADPVNNKPDFILNDGTVDFSGRYIAGSFNPKDLENSDCFLYSVDGKGNIKVLDTGLTLPNGISFSLDGKTMYVTEMFKNEITVYDYDFIKGVAGNKRTFCKIPREFGLPDGLITDSQGYLWSAHWQGWRITRYDPSGKIDKVIETPFAIATCMAFGGNNLNELYVTSAASGMTDEELKSSKNPGGLFCITTKYTGILERLFANSF